MKKLEGSPVERSVREENGSKVVGFKCRDKSRTIQSDTPGTLILNILQRSLQGHQVPGAAKTVNLGDVTKVPTEIVDIRKRLSDGKKAFMALPSGVRSQFKNDAAAFLGWLDSGPPKAHLKALGLMEPDKAPDVVLPAVPPGVPPKA